MRRARAFTLICLPLAAAAIALAGPAATAVDEPQPAPADELRAFLHGSASAGMQHWPKWHQVPAEHRHLRDRMAGWPGENQGVWVGLFSTVYETTNLPQYSVHLWRKGNRKLLVYNHGHQALPNKHTSEFVSLALARGYDVLFASMPLYGMNEVAGEHAAGRWILTEGSDAPAAIAPAVLRAHPHALFELIRDPDHYMHYFVDGAVLPVRRLASRYATVAYVGLSGGAQTGLTACAVQRFDRCVLIAGVMPEHLRVGQLNSVGDAEQVSRSFNQRFSVRKLLGIARQVSGRMTLVYNRRDPCCFSDPAASRFQAQFPDHDIRLTDLDEHGFDARAVLSILRER